MNTTEKSTASKSCWDCAHHKAEQSSLLGKCLLVDKELKATPSVSGGFVIDKGCAKWAKKEKEY